MRKWQPAWIGLGSNLGDRLAYLAAAVRGLAADSRVKVKEVSSVYHTSPVGYRRQPWFYNAAALLVTRRSPALLLSVLLRIERDLGRRRSFPGAPRVIDLDLLMHGATVVSGAWLTVPHPRLHERAFALKPCVEIAPRAVHPALKIGLARLLRRLKTHDTASKLPQSAQQRFRRFLNAKNPLSPAKWGRG